MLAFRYRFGARPIRGDADENCHGVRARSCFKDTDETPAKSLFLALNHRQKPNL